MHSLQDAVPAGRAKVSSYPSGLAGWLLDRLRGAATKRQSALKQMQLLETLPLSGKRSLMLVSCAGELFLVGGGMESIESIVKVQREASQSVAAKNADGLCL
jgi:flagellar biogenesis protein FliO